MLHCVLNNLVTIPINNHYAPQTLTRLFFFTKMKAPRQQMWKYRKTAQMSIYFQRNLLQVSITIHQAILKFPYWAIVSMAGFFEIYPKYCITNTYTCTVWTQGNHGKLLIVILGCLSPSKTMQCSSARLKAIQ